MTVQHGSRIEARSYLQWIDGSASEAASGERALSAGTVWVNCWMDGFPEMPFGGMRESGIGREQGKHAIEDFMEMKSVLFHQGPRINRWVPAPKADQL